MDPVSRSTAAGVIAGLLSSALAAAPCVTTSTPTLTPLVELYTSEGCSSCPPADRWLAKTFDNRAIAANALAFHVDYWNDLGWNDRFSSAAYTERQYAVARANHATFVYTPQIVVQGKSVRDWQDSASRIAALAARPARATIMLSITPDGDAADVDARAELSLPRGEEAKLYVALTSNGLSSDVAAGENRGVRLLHEHVVRSLSAGALADSSGHATVAKRLALPADGHDPQVVAFVETPAGEVLQSVSAPLARCIATNR